MIDWERVSDLRQEIGAEDFEEVFELFLEEVEGVVAKLNASNDRSNIEQDMHFLKGGALNLGFADFAAACSAGEMAARNGQGQSIDIPFVVQTYSASKAAFLAGRGIPVSPAQS